MKQNLLELVDVILARLQDQPEALASETGIRRWLVGQGYAKRDIEAAIKLVRPRISALPHVEEQGPGSVRHLSNYERMRLSNEARNSLARLDLYDLLDPMEREMILDRFDQFDGEIGQAELDYLVSWVVCSTRDTESQRCIYSVLDTDKATLH